MATGSAEDLRAAVEGGRRKLVRKSDAKSAVWDKFDLVVDSATLAPVGYVRCMACKAFLVYDSSKSGTSHLQRHPCKAVDPEKAIYYEVTYFITEKDVALSIVGMMGCIAAFLFFASPLSSLLHVVRTQSVETLPFPLILSAFVVSSLWTLYGFICEDAFIYTPNIMGALITACQLALFVIYPSAKQY
ncbi:hypothetical protein HPB50_020936 [Hyalomma asiaticum]|uniref:Uncharacterized protein n=1 Tax=Hyalomma asiaticum TaxID=266040 RepID=A0ACB7SYE4_HYAAI|nr:hypothetical protein HPB50_020936 [Hyalomma asiaticum]